MFTWLVVVSALFAASGILLLALCVASGRADQVAEVEAHALWRAAAHLRGLDQPRAAEPEVPAIPTLSALAEVGRRRLRAEYLCVYAREMNDHRRLVPVAGGDEGAGHELLELGEASVESGALLVTAPDGVPLSGRPVAVASAVPLVADGTTVGALVVEWPAPGRPFSPLDRAVVRHLAERASGLIADRNGRLVRGYSQPRVEAMTTA